VKELTCIGCPMGCQLQVDVLETEHGPEIRDILGYACARGERYARDEVIQPRRMVTSLVLVPGCAKPLSVRTRTAIPKALIKECLAAIRQAGVDLPVRAGDIILADVLHTGVDVIATRNLPD